LNCIFKTKSLFGDSFIFNYKILIFSLFLTLGYNRNEPDPIALCLDVSGKVERKGKIRSGLIRRGDYIYHGDKLITNEIGFASIMMIYEDTFIRIYDNSTARVLFDKEKDSNNSELLLLVGKVIIEMSKNCDHYFILNTPSTTARFTRTDFLAEYQEDLLIDKLRYSIFTSLNGRVELENTNSDQSMYLSGGETVVSTLAGKFLMLDTFRSNTGIINSLQSFR